jgi:hypothetical protein
MATIQKNAPQKQGNIFRQHVIFYGFMDSDACGLLDRIGFGFLFGFGLTFD